MKTIRSCDGSDSALPSQAGSAKLVRLPRFQSKLSPPTERGGQFDHIEKRDVLGNGLSILHRLFVAVDHLLRPRPGQTSRLQ